MKEKIYTIPVTEAFNEDCECPLCVMEKKLEHDAVEYTLGPSMMEPDSRIQTNKTGFCNRHFSRLYNIQKNRLALGLVIDTHMAEQNNKLRSLFKESKSSIIRDQDTGMLEGVSNKIKRRQTATEKYINSMAGMLRDLEHSCSICEKIRNTMDKFIDVILYLYFKENDFMKLFKSKKGFCLRHLRLLLEGAVKYLNPRQQAIFVNDLMEMQIQNLDRIQEEVNWFTKKFDYRNQDAPWKNSKDAIPRSIEKLAGPCEFN